MPSRRYDMQDRLIAEYLRKGGVMAPELDPADDPVEFVRRMIERGDFEDLNEMVRFWRAGKTFGVFFGAVRRWVIAAAALLIAWSQLNEAAVKTVRKWLGLGE